MYNYSKILKPIRFKIGLILICLISLILTNIVFAATEEVLATISASIDAYYGYDTGKHAIPSGSTKITGTINARRDQRHIDGSYPQYTTVMSFVLYNKDGNVVAQWDANSSIIKDTGKCYPVYINADLKNTYPSAKYYRLYSNSGSSYAGAVAPANITISGYRSPIISSNLTTEKTIFEEQDATYTITAEFPTDKKRYEWFWSIDDVEAEDAQYDKYSKKQKNSDNNYSGYWIPLNGTPTFYSGVNTEGKYTLFYNTLEGANGWSVTPIISESDGKITGYDSQKTTYEAWLATIPVEKQGEIKTCTIKPTKTGDSYSADDTEIGTDSITIRNAITDISGIKFLCRLSGENGVEKVYSNIATLYVINSDIKELKSYASQKKYTIGSKLDVSDPTKIVFVGAYDESTGKPEVGLFDCNSIEFINMAALKKLDSYNTAITVREAAGDFNDSEGKLDEFKKSEAILAYLEDNLCHDVASEGDCEDSYDNNGDNIIDETHYSSWTEKKTQTDEKYHLFAGENQLTSSTIEILSGENYYYAVYIIPNHITKSVVTKIELDGIDNEKPIIDSPVKANWIKNHNYTNPLQEYISGDKQFVKKSEVSKTENESILLTFDVTDNYKLFEKLTDGETGNISYEIDGEIAFSTTENGPVSKHITLTKDNVLVKEDEVYNNNREIGQRIYISYEVLPDEKNNGFYKLIIKDKSKNKNEGISEPFEINIWDDTAPKINIEVTNPDGSTDIDRYTTSKQACIKVIEEKELADDCYLFRLVSEENSTSNEYWTWKNTFVVEKPGIYEVKVKDKAGNITRESIEILKVNNENPIVSITLSPSFDELGEPVGGEDVDGMFKQYVDIIAEVERRNADSPNYYFACNTNNAAEDTATYYEANETLANGNERYTFKGIQEDGDYYIYVKDTIGNHVKVKVPVEVDIITGRKYAEVDEDGFLKAFGITITKKPMAWTKNYVDVYVNGVEGNENLRSVVFSAGETQADGSKRFTENGVFTITLTDKWGQTYTYNDEIMNIDKTAPQILNVTPINDGRYLQVNVTDGVDEKTCSCLSSASYTVKKLNQQTGALMEESSAIPAAIFEDGKFNGQFVIEIENLGEYTIKVRDRAGNVSESSITISKINSTNELFKGTETQIAENIDKGLTYSPTLDEWTNKNVIATYIPEDTTDFANNPYSWDGVNWSNSPNYPIPCNGEYMLYIKDKYNNVYHSSPITVDHIDSVEPEITLTKQGYSVSIAATDEESGVAKIRYRKDGSGTEYVLVDNGNTPTHSTSGTFKPTEAGKYTFEVVDAAGNVKSQDVTFVESEIDPEYKKDNTSTSTPTSTPSSGGSGSSSSNSGSKKNSGAALSALLSMLGNNGYGTSVSGTGSKSSTSSGSKGSSYAVGGADGVNLASKQLTPSTATNSGNDNNVTDSSKSSYEKYAYLTDLLSSKDLQPEGNNTEKTDEETKSSTAQFSLATEEVPVTTQTTEEITEPEPDVIIALPEELQGVESNAGDEEVTINNKKKSSKGWIALVALILIAGGGGFLYYWFKIRKTDEPIDDYEDWVDEEDIDPENAENDESEEETEETEDINSEEAFDDDFDPTFEG